MKFLIKGFFILTLSLSNAHSQSITDVKANQFGNNIEVVYKVNGVNENEPYDVKIVYTADNNSYSKPLEHVYGDVGQGISGNGSKKIIWDVLRETDSFEGNYAFKVIVTPKRGTDPVESPNKTSSSEAKMGKFVVTIKAISVNENNNIVINFRLLNTADNENFKIHITKSKIIGPNGKPYLAKSGKQGPKDQYGFMNVVLQKDTAVEVSLLFDYVPIDLTFLKTFEIIRYVSLGASESIVFTNIKIPR